MRAAFFGTYNRGHSANRIALAAVKAAGYEVVEIHDALWERTRDKHAGYFAPASLVRLGFQWLGAAWRLARTWRATGGAPVAVVGFNGQLDVLLLRLITGRFGPRIVFAPLVSLTETLVEDRRVYDAQSFIGRALGFLDRATCRAADVVVVDTEEHRRYFTDELAIDGSRLIVCHLGADPHTFLDAEVAANPSRTPLDVLWFGQYLPLHGLDVVVDAVMRLALRDDVGPRLRFTFIGTGEERARIQAGLEATRADLRFVDWVPYDELAARIARADIVLGIFGSSRKARMVIPNKVYEAAAVGRAIVTADTPAIHEVFAHDDDIVLCPADGPGLANAIARLADDANGEALRERIGAAARRRMEERFSTAALGRSWSVALAGPDAPVRPAEATDGELPRVGVAVLCFQDARRTLECLHSLSGDGYPALDVLVVDNASSVHERRALAEGIEGRIGAEIVWLEQNLGYAGGNNLAMKALFGRGCEYVLVLNSDTLVGRGSVAALVRTARGRRSAGPLGPRVSDTRPGSSPVSLGERYTAMTLWAPRSLVRVRKLRQHPYRVSGVTGSALLVPRALFERVGGFDESLFAYYEEVDLCLRAREAGFEPTVVPEADVGHAGARGFGAGMTPLAAWLKARNLYIVGMRRVRFASRIVFVFGYHALVAASAALYALRGRGDVARAMIAGMFAGIREESGPPPAYLFVQSGYGDARENPYPSRVSPT
jgi:GT2 family glycosyltransferase/glycosyltransferase involved in cell wall biosynthesis